MRRVLGACLLVLAAACDAPKPPTPTPTPSASPTPAPSTTPTPTPTPGAPIERSRTGSKAVDQFAGGGGAPAGPAESEEALVKAMEEARVRLGTWVQEGAGDPKVAWALAHGLVGFGKDFHATDRRLAIDVIVSDFAELKTVGGKQRVYFPKKTKEGRPLEPHTSLMVKSLLEAEVPRDRLFVVKGLGKVPLSRIAEDVLAEIERPNTEAEWQDFAWSLTALLLYYKDQAQPKGAPNEIQKKLVTLSLETIAYLEGQQAFLVEAMESNHPERVEKRKQFIFAHTCGGTHLIQAAVRAAVFVGTPEVKARVKKQLQILLFRHQAERRIYTEALAKAPNYALILHTQELKFFGHVLETFALAQPLGMTEGSPEERARLGLVAKDLIQAVNVLGPAYHQLGPIRAEREQTYLDLIGDGCHAMRGLRQGIVALFRHG